MKMKKFDLGLLLFVIILLFVGCSEPTTKDGYKVRISDGWVSDYFDCYTYKKDGQNLQCFDKSGEKIREVFMPTDMRFTISKYGEVHGS